MDRLREEVRSIPIPLALLKCLKYSKENLKDVNIIGVFWFDSNKFFINTRKFASFIGRKSDTIKHNLAGHEFCCLKMKLGEKKRRLDELKVDPICPKSWVAREHTFFNSESKESDILNMKFISKKNVNNCFDTSFDTNYNIDFGDDDDYYNGDDLNDSYNDDDLNDSYNGGYFSFYEYL